jgi:nucleoside-diphosphate-sugar epimerase
VGYAHVIPDLVRKIMSGQYPLELLGDGQQTRCFTHVSDIADGIITVATLDKAKNEDFNIGTDNEIKMIDLARKIWDVMGEKKPFKVKYVKGFQYDIRRRVPNVSKAKELLNWEPKVKFEEGLKEVVGWLKRQKIQGKLS